MIGGVRVRPKEIVTWRSMLHDYDRDSFLG